jgi:hypothetical protein
MIILLQYLVKWATIEIPLWKSCCETESIIMVGSKNLPWYFVVMNQFVEHVMVHGSG